MGQPKAPPGTNTPTDLSQPWRRGGRWSHLDGGTDEAAPAVHL